MTLFLCRASSNAARGRILRFLCRQRFLTHDQRPAGLRACESRARDTGPMTAVHAGEDPRRWNADWLNPVSKVVDKCGLRRPRWCRNTSPARLSRDPASTPLPITPRVRTCRIRLPDQGPALSDLPLRCDRCASSQGEGLHQSCCA